MSEKKSFYFFDNIEYLLSNGFKLVGAEVVENDLGICEKIYIFSKNGSVELIRIKKVFLCKFDLANNESFINKYIGC